MGGSLSQRICRSLSKTTLLKMADELSGGVYLLSRMFS